MNESRIVLAPVSEGILERIERKLDQLVVGQVRAERKLDQLTALMSVVLVTQGEIMIELDQLEEQVNETATVEESTVVLLEGILTRLDQAGTNPAKLMELKEKLRNSQQRLAAAVANVPPAPTPTP